jgi:plastocyanin
MKATILLFSLLFVSSEYFINESFAEISENQAFLLEGSGFAVTAESIKISEIDLGLSSQQQRGSTIDFLIEDGFITLDNEEFIISELQGKFLREGRYIRINGNIESSNGLDTTISFFGRLVEESKDAAVYGFTGKITTIDDTYKIIFTTKLSTLSKTVISTDSEKSTDLTIHILKNSAAQETTDDIIPGLDAAQHLRFFSMDRISIDPGTVITFVNDDDTSHRLVSGTGNSNLLNGKICSEIADDIPEGFNYIPAGSEGRDCDFIFDGRINTGEIASGDSITITFDERGFYRLLDPDYPWMRIDGYVFSNLNDNLIFGEGQNLGN